MKCKKCGKAFGKKAMNVIGKKGKNKYFARYLCPVCSLSSKAIRGYS
jgi:hypothetical protein